MNWIVTAGNIAASRLTRKPILLASLEDLFFLQPVRVGDVVTVKAMVEYIGKTSLEVKAFVFCKPLNDTEKLCTRARMSFVSSDARGNPVPIQQHIEPADDNETKMYHYARKMRERRFERIAQRKQKLLDINLEDVGQLNLRVYRLIFPEDAIYGNLMFGGNLLLILDEIMTITSMKFAKSTIVTASLDALDFYHPIFVGNILVLAASLNYIGRSSMEVGVKVLAEDITNNTIYHACTAFATCVKVDENGRPKPLPSFMPATDVEKKRWSEAEQRKQQRLQRLTEFKETELGQSTYSQKETAKPA